MNKEHYPSPDEAKVQRIREEIDEWEGGTNNFHLYLIPEEEIGGVVGMSYSLNWNTATQIAEKSVGEEGSKYGNIVEAITEFSESEEWSTQFEHITRAEQFARAKEAVIEWWRLPLLSQEKSELGTQLEAETLKPLLKEMVPVLLEHNVDPKDLTT